MVDPIVQIVVTKQSGRYKVSLHTAKEVVEVQYMETITHLADYISGIAELFLVGPP